MADKIVVMNSGVVEQVGPPLELYDRPANLFVAGFIGSPAMNMIEGSIADGRCARPTARDLAAARQRQRPAWPPDHLRHPARASAARSRGHRRQACRWSSRPGRRRRCCCASASQSADRRLPRAHHGEAGRDCCRISPTPRWCICSTGNPANASTRQRTTGGHEHGVHHHPARRTAPTAGGAAAAALAGQAGAQSSARRRAQRPSCRSRRAPRLRMLRPARFVEPDEVIFRANTAKFQQTTGVETRVDFVGWEDIRQQTAVAANTGTGPDIIIGWSRGPARLRRQADRADRRRRISRQAVRRLDLPRREVRQEGQDQQLDRPCRSAAAPARSVYRKSAVKEAGFDTHPERPCRLPEALPGAEEDQQAGRLRARQRGRRRQRLRQLAAVVARRLSGRRGRQGRDQQQGDDRRAEIPQGAVSDLRAGHAGLGRSEQQPRLCGERVLADRQRRLALLRA